MGACFFSAPLSLHKKHMCVFFRFKNHMIDLLFMEKIARWLTNTQVKIKSEVANSNSQAKNLARSLNDLEKQISSCEHPTPDTEASGKITGEIFLCAGLSEDLVKLLLQQATWFFSHKRDKLWGFMCRSFSSTHFQRLVSQEVLPNQLLGSLKSLYEVLQQRSAHLNCLQDSAPHLRSGTLQGPPGNTRFSAFLPHIVSALHKWPIQSRKFGPTWHQWKPLFPAASMKTVSQSKVGLASSPEGTAAAAGVVSKTSKQPGEDPSIVIIKEILQFVFCVFSAPPPLFFSGDTPEDRWSLRRL